MPHNGLHGKPQPIDLGAYIRSISDLSRITSEDEIRLANAWREGASRDARDRLITANLRLVIALARRYSGRGVPLDELVAEGNVGLIHAVDNFNPAAGCRFSTYAVYWIRQSIGQAFARASSRSKLSSRDRLEIAELEKADLAFVASHGKRATGAELAEILGWGADRVRGAQQLAAARVRTQSITDALPVDVTHAENQSTGDEDAPAGEVDETGRDVRRLLESLPAPERRAVELRFGLDSGQARAVGAVASILGLTPRNVKSLLRSALVKLARSSRTGSHRLPASLHFAA